MGASRRAVELDFGQDAGAQRAGPNWLQWSARFWWRRAAKAAQMPAPIRGNAVIRSPIAGQALWKSIAQSPFPKPARRKGMRVLYRQYVAMTNYCVVRIAILAAAPDGSERI